MTRRESLLIAGGAPLAAAASETFDPEIVRKHDTAVEYYLKNQVTADGRWQGALPDAYGLHAPGSAVGMWDIFATAFLCPQSKFAKSNLMVERLALAAKFIDRSTTPEGNIYLPVTNFNSPPDSAFAVRTAAQTALNARRGGAKEISTIVEPRLKRMVEAITTGGIHTPNHRWVVGAGLAQANELWPDSRYVRRIDQWLAEGLDIDADGQWSERSTVTYNPICDACFVVMADKLKRPALLEPARRNLESMLYLLHAGGEVDTSFSRRQDLHTRGTMAGYWFPLHYLAVKDRDGRFGTLSRQLWPVAAPLSTLMAYPELNRQAPVASALPSDYVREMPHNQVLRIRRGLASATVHTGGRDQIVSLRYGDAIVNAVRFASAFFGKGQFVPSEMEKVPGGVKLTQRLDGPYFQPFDPPRVVDADEWDRTQPTRPRTQVCRMTHSATVTEIAKGLRVEIAAEGTDDVPVAVEISVRDGAKIEGVDGHLFRGEEARVSSGPHSMRITGGGCEHRYTDVRGALPRFPGQSIYATGLTPFRRTFDFLWG